jgi:general secretion pathway protein C
MLGPLIRNAPTLAVLGLLLLAGWLAARWFLYFFAPTDVSPARPRQQEQLGMAAQAAADANLFGVAPTRGGGQVVSNLNIKLKGVVAGGATGAAIVNTGGKDEAAQVGGEIAPGVVLESVHPQYMVVRRNGALERVNIEERQQIAAAVSPVLQRRTAAPAVGATSQVVQSPPAPTNPDARSQRPPPYAPVGDVPTYAAPAPASPPPGAAPPPATAAAIPGLAITSIPPGSMLERLGLQTGDVIRSVNGEAVTNETDVARIVQARGMQGPFTAEVERNGLVIPIVVGQPR